MYHGQLVGRQALEAQTNVEAGSKHGPEIQRLVRPPHLSRRQDTRNNRQLNDETHRGNDTEPSSKESRGLYGQHCFTSASDSHWQCKTQQHLKQGNRQRIPCGSAGTSPSA